MSRSLRSLSSAHALRFVLVLLALLSCAAYGGMAQNNVSGRTVTGKGEPIFAVTVLLVSDNSVWTSSDMDGNFSIPVQSIKDTLHFICMGYKDLLAPVSDIVREGISDFILEEDNLILPGVTVTAQNPISERSTVYVINAMDIYMNPMSQADPLKAISLLPSHTGTDESANPSFRGSSSDRSVITLNGIPVYNPVRSSQLNNQGFFSIFNPEVIGNEYVHPGNPPLTYGNTSAGLVEIESKCGINRDMLQLSLGLASTGLFLSKLIRQDRSFVQAWTNYQFSDAFIGMQRKYYPETDRFWNVDAGINFYGRVGQHMDFKSYMYFLKEGYSGRDWSLNYYGPVTYGNVRVLGANSFRYMSGGSTVSLNAGADWSNPGTVFGNILCEENETQLFASLNWKQQFHADFNFQTGITFEHHRYRMWGHAPAFFFALSPDDPVIYTDTVSTNTILEAYVYSNWDITRKLLLSAGVRSNIPVSGRQRWYLSGQLALKYSFGSDHWVRLSAGRYNSYSRPDFYQRAFNHLTSDQLSLDYSLTVKRTSINAAVYMKIENGRTATGMMQYNVFDRSDIIGAEVAFSQVFLKNFKLSLSNTFLRQRVMIDSVFYLGPRSLEWFVKSSLEYSNPDLFTVAISYTTHQGMLYSSVSGSVFVPEAGTYMPLYMDWYDTRYPTYHRIDLTVNRYIPLGKYALTLYLSVNNLLDTKNPGSVFYNMDYTENSWLYLQRRSFYFGVVFSMAGN